MAGRDPGDIEIEVWVGGGGKGDRLQSIALDTQLVCNWKHTKLGEQLL